MLVLFAYVANAQPDGGTAADTPFIDPRYTSDPAALESETAIVWQKGTGHQHSVTGGCWLSERTCIESAARQVEERIVVRELVRERTTLAPEQLAIIVGLMGAAFAAGFAAAKFQR